MVEKRRLLTAREAAEYLHISLLTLAKIEKQGGIIPYRTPGGHRRYTMEMLNEYLERSRSISYGSRAPKISQPEVVRV